jgi:hypothetical protein
MAIQFRRALAATWTSVNPVLADGQPGLEKDTRKVKYGDGVTPWNDLPYAAGGTGGAVDSVAGKTGAVSLTKSDVGLTNVDNTADTAKPVSTTQATAISGAQTAAVSAAATDATTKANAAQSAATTAAASDATSKANAAQSAAIAAAATDATTKADAAKARATHTGTQAISTVTGLQTAIDAKITNPAGAVSGQILAKSGSTEAWVDVPDGSLPTGGTDGQILAKSGTTGVWTDAPPSTPADGSITTVKLGPAAVTAAKLGADVTQDAVPDGTTAKQYPATDKTKLAGIATGATANATNAALRDTDTHTDGTTNKVYPATDKTKLAGIATGATVNSTDAALRDRSTHTGTQSADSLTDGTTNKAFLATERTKLTGIAAGATVNDTDANLKARANHTGTQSADTITDGTTNKAYTGTEQTKLAGIATGATANQSDATTNAAIAAKETPAGAQAKADAALYTATATAAQKASNLSDLTDTAAARANLGAAATTAVTSLSTTVDDHTDELDTLATSVASNTSTLSAKANQDATGITDTTWRTALGLGDAAVKNTGTTSTTLAAGDAPAAAQAAAITRSTANLAPTDAVLSRRRTRAARSASNLLTRTRISGTTGRNILVIGDSNTEGWVGPSHRKNTWVNQLTQSLRQGHGSRVGAWPTGYAAACAGAEGFLGAPAGPVFTRGGSPTLNDGYDGNSGPGLRSVTLGTTAQYLEFTAVCDRYLVLYRQIPSGGTIQTKHDGTNVTTFSTANATTKGSRVFDSGALTLASRVVRLVPTATANCVIEGVFIMQGGLTNVTVWDGGHTAARAYDYLGANTGGSGTANYFTDVFDTAAGGVSAAIGGWDHVVIALGSNEMNPGNAVPGECVRPHRSTVRGGPRQPRGRHPRQGLVNPVQTHRPTPRARSSHRRLNKWRSLMPPTTRR